MLKEGASRWLLRGWAGLLFRSLGFFEFLDALSDREVFLYLVLAHDKEAARLLKLRMRSHLEVGKVRELLLTSLMEANDLLDKSLIVAFEPLSILFQVENGAALRLNLIDVEVVDASDLVASLRSLNIFLLFRITLLGLLFGHSQFVLDAEVIVTALSTPELLQILTLEL